MSIVGQALAIRAGDVAGIVENAAGHAPRCIDAAADRAAGKTIREAGAFLWNKGEDLFVGAGDPRVGVFEDFVGDGTAPGSFAIMAGAGDFVLIEVDGGVRGAALDGEVDLG